MNKPEVGDECFWRLREDLPYKPGKITMLGIKNQHGYAFNMEVDTLDRARAKSRAMVTPHDMFVIVPKEKVPKLLQRLTEELSGDIKCQVEVCYLWRGVDQWNYHVVRMDTLQVLHKRAIENYHCKLVFTDEDDVTAYEANPGDLEESDTFYSFDGQPKLSICVEDFIATGGGNFHKEC